MENPYRSCELCNRRCGVDRIAGKRGFCRCDALPRIAHADLHLWEEPIISGERGSGTIFFSGCSLGCIFCQNKLISDEPCGREVDSVGLADVMLKLSGRGAHNINFVTPTHFAPSVIEAVSVARARGLTLPIVYNTGSYDTVEAVRALEGTVDVFLPDYKYYKAETAARYSSAPSYPEYAFSAIAEMVRQRPEPRLSGGIITGGVIVRVLLLPSHVAEAKLAVRRLYDAFGSDIYLSLMCQYTPIANMPKPLDRRVSMSEYSELVSYAERIGVVNGFTQEPSSASDSYIPRFNLI